MNETDFHVFWKNVHVGTIHDPIPDMWYLEGQFSRQAGEESVEFERRIRQLNGQEVYMDSSKSVPIQLKQVADDKYINALVISFTGDILFLRRIR